MRSNSQLLEALTHAEEALTMATKANLHGLVGKAQFHRGMCFLYQNCHANARWCFVLAGHTEGHSEIVEIHRHIAEENLEKLPVGHPGRDISLSC